MKKTTTQLQVHVHGKPVHTFQLRILNWKTGKCDEIPFSTPHSQFSSFPVSVCYVTSFSNWKTGKLKKLENCKQCLKQGTTRLKCTQAVSQIHTLMTQPLHACRQAVLSDIKRPRATVDEMLNLLAITALVAVQ